MAQNQSPAKSTAEGELSLDDLEKIAGGTNTESAASFLANRANKVEQSNSLSVTHNNHYDSKFVPPPPPEEP